MQNYTQLNKYILKQTLVDFPRKRDLKYQHPYTLQHTAQLIET